MERLTDEDIAEANEDRLAELARLARLVAFFVIAAGVIGIASWLWFTIRAQSRVGDAPVFSFSTDDSGFWLANRLDVFVGTIHLLIQGSIALVLGSVGYLWSSKVLATTGRSLHGVSVGDPIPDLDDRREADDGKW